MGLRVWIKSRRTRCRINEEWQGLFIGRRWCATHRVRWDDGGPCPDQTPIETAGVGWYNRAEKAEAERDSLRAQVDAVRSALDTADDPSASSSEVLADVRAALDGG